MAHMNVPETACTSEDVTATITRSYVMSLSVV